MAQKDIQMTSIDPVTRKISFGIEPKQVSGIYKLVQVVVLSLMDTPGRAVLAPELGGGLPSLLSYNIDMDDSTELFAEVARIVRRTERDIINAQISVQDSPEEKLRELQIMSIDQTADDEVAIRIRIVNEAGRATDIAL